MDLLAFPPLAAVLDLMSTGLVALSGLLAALAPGWGAALAVVSLTLTVRALLIPLGVRQFRAQLARTRLAPRLAELQRRHRRSPERLQQETMALYRREGVSPFAGLMPALVQLPIVGIVYAVFTQAQVGGHPNALLAETLLGIPLGSAWTAQLGAALLPAAAVGAGLTAWLLVTAWLSRRQLRGSMPATELPGGAGLARLAGLMPFLVVPVAAFVPLAAGLWIAVSSAWGVAERAVLRRVLTTG